jgi:rfaE bifunctional protein kinase chain/domain
MEKSTLFNNITQLKVAIIGDVMIDNYIYGKVNRMSPEAPVPVVDVFKKESRLGGAANVALNIKALGATPYLISVLGDDGDGRKAEKLLVDAGITDTHILLSPDRKTTVKTRILGNNRQIARVDQELSEQLNDKDNKRLLNTINNIIDHVDIVILEDYDKGILGPENIDKIVSLANAKNVPTAVDPKFNNFKLFKNVTLFKPNLKELSQGMKTKLNRDYSIEDIMDLEKSLRQEMGYQIGLITLSERGILIQDKEESISMDAHSRNISDVSGAGDTVISVAACVYAAGASLKTVAEISNLAGGLVCEYPGVVPIDKERLVREIN